MLRRKFYERVMFSLVEFYKNLNLTNIFFFAIYSVDDDINSWQKIMLTENHAQLFVINPQNIEHFRINDSEIFEIFHFACLLLKH